MEKGKKISISAEDEKYLRENFRTTRNKDLCKRFGVVPKSMMRILIRLGFIRTREDISYLTSIADKPSDKSRSRKIEGGSRKNPLAEKHRRMWIAENGSLPSDCILMYANKRYDDPKDLVLVRKVDYEKFVTKREKAIADEKKKEKREEKMTKARIREEKHRKALKEEKEKEEFLASIKQKSPAESITEEIQRDKVPVRLDSRTTVFVKREKCTQNEYGAWVLKPGETIKVQPVDSYIQDLIRKHEQKEGKQRKKKRTSKGTI